MIQQELEVINYLNNQFKLNLKNTTKDEFKSYDAFNDNYIVEIKCRNDYYETKLIEVYKLTKNYQIAQLENKMFLYVVKDIKGYSVFNITENICDILKLPFELKEMKHTTEFKSGKWISKIIVNLPAKYNKIKNKLK